MKKADTKKAAAADEDFEDAVEEETEEAADDEGEDDFRARAKKNVKKVAGKKTEEGGKKVKGTKKVAKKTGPNTSNGVARKEWATPWRPSSVLAQAFELAQKNASVKDLTALAKKNDAEPQYVIGAMKRKKTRNWKWETKVSDTHIKILNAHAAGAKKAA